MMLRRNNKHVTHKPFR